MAVLLLLREKITSVLTSQAATAILHKTYLLDFFINLPSQILVLLVSDLNL